MRRRSSFALKHLTFVLTQVDKFDNFLDPVRGQRVITKMGQLKAQGGHIKQGQGLFIL